MWFWQLLVLWVGWSKRLCNLPRWRLWHHGRHAPRHAHPVTPLPGTGKYMRFQEVKSHLHGFSTPLVSRKPLQSWCKCTKWNHKGRAICSRKKLWLFSRFWLRLFGICPCVKQQGQLMDLQNVECLLYSIIALITVIAIQLKVQLKECLLPWKLWPTLICPFHNTKNSTAPSSDY